MREIDIKVNGRVAGMPVTWVALLLFAATLALFWPARGYDYINLDDYPYVKDHLAVAQGLTGAGIREAFLSVRENWWLPLLWISYMADTSLFGEGPHGHHWVNILLHATNAVLLFWALWRMTGCKWRSAFVAALFAWHPTRVEAVAWIAARKDVLSGLFLLLAVLAYVWHQEKTAVRRMALVAGLMVAGLLSKAIVVTLPFLLLVLDAWPLRRAPLAGPKTASQWKPLLLEKIPLFGLSAAFMVINVVTHTAGRGDGSVTWGQRLGLMGPNVLAYLRLAVFPTHLNLMYPESDSVWWPWTMAASGAVLVALWGGWTQRKSRPWLLAGWLWFLVALAPVVRGVRMGLAQYADRWMYLPLIGLGLMAAWAAGEWARDGRRRMMGAVVGGLALAACLVLSSVQLRNWRDSLTLFMRAVRLAPEHAVVQNSLGQAIFEAGRLAECEPHLAKAIRMDPKNADYLSNYGVLLLRTGRVEEALRMQDRAVELKPGAAILHNNRGNVLEALGRKAEARASFEEALRLNPAYPEAHFNLGGLLFNLGKPMEALGHFEAAVQGHPGEPMNWYNLGVTYAQLGQYGEARSCVERALAINPQTPGAVAALARIRLLDY